MYLYFVRQNPDRAQWWHSWSFVNSTVEMVSWDVLLLAVNSFKSWLPYLFYDEHGVETKRTRRGSAASGRGREPRPSPPLPSSTVSTGIYNVNMYLLCAAEIKPLVIKPPKWPRGLQWINIWFCTCYYYYVYRIYTSYCLWSFTQRSQKDNLVT